MQTIYWGWLATPAASLIAGLVSLGIIIWAGKHRDGNGAVSRIQVSSSVMLASTTYMLTIILAGFFFLRITVGDTINKGFGDEKVAWLFVFVCLDMGVRLVHVYEGKSLNDFIEV